MNPSQLHEYSQHQGNTQKDPTQLHESSLHQGNPQHHEDPTQLHESSQHQRNAQTDPTQLHESSLHRGNSQHHEDPTQLHESSQHQGNAQNNIEPAPPSQIWPNDLISILQKIMATPCQPPTKPIFKFDLSIEAASKNYILLKHTFGGDLQRALNAQPNSPLQYGSKFRQIETLKSILENHPSWNRMRSALTFGSS
jgi:hypothetical protein